MLITLQSGVEPRQTASTLHYAVYFFMTDVYETALLYYSENTPERIAPFQWI